jgi:membrane-associated phospholipid phosphatase
LRYRIPGTATVERDESSERLHWSWFFRFWTNFASAPSLSFWSLAFPFWMWHMRRSQSSDDAAFATVLPWLLPGICYYGSMLMSYVLKRVFKRVRPPRKGYAFGHKLKDPSFPSGHSLTAFCFWTMLAIVVTVTSTSVPTVLAFALVGAAIILLTGLSRVYLGVHFPSDVLGGYFIGTVWCLSCYGPLRRCCCADSFCEAHF